MAQLNVYMLFNGECREAMTFYQACLGGELTLQTIGESPIAGQMPAEVQNNIMHSVLKNDAFTLMASDMGDAPVHGDTLSLMLYCESEAEIHDVFAKMSQGGTVKFPLAEQFWGALYGEVVDKYGYRWLFNYDKPRA